MCIGMDPRLVNLSKDLFEMFGVAVSTLTGSTPACMKYLLLRIYMYVCMYVCMYVYICTYVHVYV